MSVQSAAAPRRDVWTLVSISILVLFLLFLCYPLIKIVYQAFFDQEGAFSLENFRRFFGQRYYFMTLVNSFKVGIAVTFYSLLLGIPLAYIYCFFDLKGKKTVYVLSILCSMSAPFIGAYSWILMMGRNGIITKLFANLFGIKLGTIYGFSGIVLVQSLKLFPLVFIYMIGAFRNIDNSLLEASESLGCSGINRFFKLTFMLSMPTILAAALLVFMRSFSDFGVPLLIGEGYRTFTVEIYSQYLNEMGGNNNFAAAISVVAILITTAVFLLQKATSKRFGFTINAMNPIQPKRPNTLMHVLSHVFSYCLVALAFLPQIYVMVASFRNMRNQVVLPGYSLNNYRLAIDKGAFRYMGNTLKIGLISLAVILLFAILIAYLVVRRRSVLNSTIDTLSMIPYIIPGSVVGISMIMAFNTRPLILTGTVFIMVVAVCIRRMPYTIRSSVAILQQIPMSIEEASVSLGATKMKTFFGITVPMMSPGVISGAIMSWVAIITELSSAIILYSNRSLTLTLAIYTNIVRGTEGIATAYATMLMILTMGSIGIYMAVSKDGEISV